MTKFATRAIHLPMKTITTHDAKTHLSQYLNETERGGKFVIARGRKPVAMLVPIAISNAKPRPKVGVTMDPRMPVPDAAFAPLTAEELKNWQG